MTKSASGMSDTGGSPSSSTQLPDWPLRRPASRRISNPVSLRLQTITEGQGPNAPPIPPRSSMRDSGSSWSLHHNDAMQPPPSRDGRRSTDRPGTAPPAYEWVPDPNPEDANVDGRRPIEGEKLARLRRGGGYMRQSRGGLKRLFLIVAVLLVVIIGLVVGLGVGLTVGKHHSNQGQQSGQPAGTKPNTGPQNEPFPLGQYSYVTNLTAVSNNCTSNPATWSCYTTFNPSDTPTDQSGNSIFNWVITKTDLNYATIGSGATSDAGIPANLTISSINNPFGLNFPDKNLTYIASATNSSAARLTFNFTMSKPVVPTSPLAGNAATVCFFNQTTFAGTLYLSAGRRNPSSGNSSSTSYQQWPFAIEVTQSSPGGDNIPACYNFSGGRVGAPVAAGLSAQGPSTQCVCNYRNDL